MRYDPKERCPDLRVSDEGDAVAVVFLVNAYGAPSQAHVRAASAVPGLDAAAVSCVMKIRFQPATRPGMRSRWIPGSSCGCGMPSPAHAAAAPAGPTQLDRSRGRRDGGCGGTAAGAATGSAHAGGATSACMCARMPRASSRRSRW